ncbi:hypothetical protein KUCAC02_026980 [Chaenocephalus aceratus]|nr:hypothetical protein KUCAC02_026980 [Chaenocephalus aceratus]
MYFCHKCFNTDVQPSPEKKIYWQFKCVPYDGVPFQLLEDHVFNARRHLVQNTKKMDCPGQITVSQVMTCPGFKIAENSKAKRRELSAALKAVVAADPSTVEVVMESTRASPQKEAELREPMDSRAAQQRVKLTLAGARKLSESRRHRFNLVNDELFRGSSHLHEHVEAWQRRLLRLYGRQTGLLDATYRTCRTLFPSSSYVVRQQQVFEEWTPDRSPSHFMVDFSEVEIGALEEEFQGSKVLLCDFHRENAWVDGAGRKITE